MLVLNNKVVSSTGTTFVVGCTTLGELLRNLNGDEPMWYQSRKQIGIAVADGMCGHITVDNVPESTMCGGYWTDLTLLPEDSKVKLWTIADWRFND
jgi:hypothetical protein